MGDRVAALAEQAYAGYVAAPAKHTHLLPADVTFAQGAATLLQGVTALSLIREAALPLRAGEWALVHAAAGGTGSWLCQLLRALGMKAIGVASTPEKMTIASDAGATVVLNSSEGDLVARVMHLTDDQGVAAVFDGVGRETWDVSMACLARKGTMVSFGNASGAVPAVQPL